MTKNIGNGTDLVVSNVLGIKVLGILHSTSLADLLLAPFQRACAVALRRVGRALDAQRGAGDATASRVLSGELLEVPRSWWLVGWLAWLEVPEPVGYGNLLVL